MTNTVTVYQAAILLQVGIDTVYRLLYSGKLTGEKVPGGRGGGQWAIPLSAIKARQEYLAKRRKSDKVGGNGNG